MRRIYITLMTIMAVILSVRAQEDSLKASRYLLRSTLFGAGYTNVYESYLSPVEYKGPELRLLHERMQMTRLLDGNVSRQSILQVQASSTRNFSQTGKMYTALVNWSYALHYQFRVHPQLKLMIGPYVDVNGGVIYNPRNSNNPAQAKAYGSLGASGMALYKFRIGNYPLAVRYQANLPLAGVMFSPEFGESYYEIFALRNGGKNVRFTSLHNQPSLRQMVTLDFPIRNTIIRVGYVCDIQQARVNHLRSHIYSHDFMIGFVHNIRLLRGKNRISMPENVTPF